MGLPGCRPLGCLKHYDDGGFLLRCTTSDSVSNCDFDKLKIFEKWKNAKHQQQSRSCWKRLFLYVQAYWNVQNENITYYTASLVCQRLSAKHSVMVNERMTVAQQILLFHSVANFVWLGYIKKYHWISSFCCQRWLEFWLRCRKTIKVSNFS